MSNFGRLAVSALAANTNTSVYTVPSNCDYVELSVSVLNTNITDATVELALATTGTPNANEYIEKGSVIPANGGVLERTDIVCSPGEIVVVKSSQANVIVRVSGKEIIED